MEDNDSNLLLSKAIENCSGIIVFALDKSYRYTAYTKSHFQVMKQIWGAEIHPGANMLQYLSPEDAAKAKHNFDRALSGERFTIVEEYGSEDLTRSFWEDRYDPMYDSEGNVSGVVVFVLDVSEHLSVAKDLMVTQKRLNLALRNGPVGVWEWNIITNEIYWSAEVYQIFCLPPDFTPDFQSYQDTIYSEDLPNLLGSIQHTIQTGAPYSVEHRIVHQGKIIWIRGIGELVLDEAGNPNYLLGTVQDISRDKEREEEIQRKNQELTKTNEELDRFVYSASHDLRAPIASLLGLIKVARLENDHSKMMELLSMQEKCLERLDSFIRDIVDFSRNSRLSRLVRQIDFEEMINNTFEQFKYLENSEHITCKVEIEASPFYSDKTRLQIILNNLISNSIKYMDVTKPESWIKVSVRPQGAGVCVEVEDNGQGIKPEFIDKVFEMFYRASENGPGSGLGLYIVQNTVEKLDGTISITSLFGSGTKVVILLPSLEPELP